ncbi:hypothetical protein B0H12DRAFT_1242705 [Mycena haematopus]|nr:hypothetical protein B0H12DRAFT_1242705 [Mycena haematopus]
MTAHPYLCGSPLPSSAQQPGLRAKICYFNITREKLASDYPYEISSTPGRKAGVEFFRIPYCEISGLGPPPTDLHGSHLGDVYLDLSPAPGQYAAYGRVADHATAWKRWYDPQPFNKREEILVKHPHFRNRILWCSAAHGVSWFVVTTVTSHQERAKLRRLVSMDLEKTEETRWREASALIRVALGESEEWQEARRSTSPLSPLSPLGTREPTPLSVLGKRKTRSQKELDRSTTCLEAKRYKALLRRSIQQLKDEKADSQRRFVSWKSTSSPTRTSRVLLSQNSFRNGQRRSSWMGSRRYKGMDPSVREYWDLRDELAAGVRKKKKSWKTSDLSRAAISEHKRLKCETLPEQKPRI